MVRETAVPTVPAGGVSANTVPGGELLVMVSPMMSAVMPAAAAVLPAAVALMPANCGMVPVVPGRGGGGGGVDPDEGGVAAGVAYGRLEHVQVSVEQGGAVRLHTV